MIIPENIISKTLQAFIDTAIASYTNDASIGKLQNIIYDLFFQDDNGEVLAIQNFNYYTQALGIICRKNTDNRMLEIYQGYNLERKGLPTIHILLPHEGKGRQDSLGDSIGDPAITIEENDMVTLTKSKSFAATYQLMISSNNASEVLLIYYFLRGMFIMFDEHLELKGLRNIQFGGSDISFQPELPPGIFHRNLSISCDYLIEIKTRFPANIITGLTITADICDGV